MCCVFVHVLCCTHVCNTQTRGAVLQSPTTGRPSSPRWLCHGWHPARWHPWQSKQKLPRQLLRQASRKWTWHSKVCALCLVFHALECIVPPLQRMSCSLWRRSNSSSKPLHSRRLPQWPAQRCVCHALCIGHALGGVFPGGTSGQAPTHRWVGSGASSGTCRGANCGRRGARVGGRWHAERAPPHPAGR